MKKIITILMLTTLAGCITSTQVVKNIQVLENQQLIVEKCELTYNAFTAMFGTENCNNEILRIK